MTLCLALDGAVSLLFNALKGVLIRFRAGNQELFEFGSAFQRKTNMINHSPWALLSPFSS